LKIVVFEGTGSVWPKISGKRCRPPSIIRRFVTSWLGSAV